MKKNKEILLFTISVDLINTASSPTQLRKIGIQAKMSLIWVPIMSTWAVKLNFSNQNTIFEELHEFVIFFFFSTFLHMVGASYHVQIYCKGELCWLSRVIWHEGDEAFGSFRFLVGLPIINRWLDRYNHGTYRWLLLFAHWYLKCYMSILLRYFFPSFLHNLLPSALMIV